MGSPFHRVSVHDDHSPLVLIVDDERLIAEAVAAVVLEAGYAVAVATNGRDGLEIALKQRPVLILTDLMMPMLDGAGFIAALREAATTNETFQAPPIVVMSAANRCVVNALGVEGILAKPFAIEELERLLHELARPTCSMPSCSYTGPPAA